VRSKRVVVGSDHAPCPVAALAVNLPASRGYRRKVSEGTKGPIAYAFARQRVTLCKEGLPERTVWLVIKRTVGTNPVYSYSISNTPASTPWRIFVWLSGVRWAIEPCFEEVKTELWMDHYEVRKYPGWHHHMLTTMLAHFFLWHLKLRVKKKAPALTGSQLRTLLAVVLPLRTYTIEEVLELVAWVQRRTHQAYHSHRERRQEDG